MSRDDHLTPNLVRALLEGRIAADAAFRRLARHAASLCASCAAGLAAAEGADPAPAEGAGPPPAEEPIWTAGASRAWARGRGVDPAAAAAAERRVEALAELPPGERAEALRADSRARGEELVLQLVIAARSRLWADPQAALQWAELGRLVAELSGLAEDDLGILAASNLANARRAANDLAGAWDLFEQQVVSREVDRPLEDPAIAAEVSSQYASLLVDLRLFDEAFGTLLSAVALAEVAGDLACVGKILMQMANAHYYQGNGPAAVETIRQAIRLLTEEDPDLALAARFNLIQDLLGAGQVAEARQEYEEYAALFPPSWAVKRTWVEGQVAAAEGDVGGAERAFVEVRRQSLETSRPLDVAMVCFDLADLYLACGREAEVPALVDEAVRVFAAEPHMVPAQVIAAFERLLQAGRTRAEARAALERHLLSDEMRPVFSDPAVANEAWSLYGLLLVDLRDLEPAVEALGRSLELARAADDPARIGRALVLLATAQEWRGELGQAADLGRQALDLLPPEEPLRRVARLNLIHHLLLLGETAEARRRLEETEEDFPASWSTQLRWLEARLAAAEGDAEAAEQAFLDVRRELLEASLPLDLARVTLDLSGLYLAHGRAADVPPLVAQVVERLATTLHPVPGHVVTAVEQVRRAAEAGILEASTLARLSQHLRDLRSRPHLPEQTPS